MVIVTALIYVLRDRRGHDRMEVAFTTTYAISALSVRISMRRGVLDTT
jgi:hypothetical protein